MLLLASEGRNEMKRSFQVATIFTGAVACATALAPTGGSGNGGARRHGKELLRIVGARCPLGLRS
jgi:hypothetical protein